MRDVPADEEQHGQGLFRPDRVDNRVQVARNTSTGLLDSGNHQTLHGAFLLGKTGGVVGIEPFHARDPILSEAEFLGQALVLMPFGGVAADRMERRRILLATQWVMAILAVVMGVLIQESRLALWHVWVIALLLGIATAYDLPAYQSFYPQLVEPQDLPQAISLNQATFHGSRIIGPAIAAWFVARWGNAAAFYANGASFLAVIVSLMLIRPRPPATGGGPVNMVHFMAEGVTYVRERPKIVALLGLTAITTLFVFPNMAILMPYYAQHVLNVGPGGLGWMMAVSGAGAFLGATFLLTIPRSIRVGWIMAALVVITATLSVLAWSRHLGVSVAAVALQAFFGEVLV